MSVDTARRSAVAGLLRSRAAAVREHDRARFMSTVDDAAAPRFRAAQRRLFASLSGVPLSHFAYRLSGARAFAAPPGAVPGSPQSVWAPKVTLRYALAGIDAEPVAEPMGYVFAKRHGRWYLDSDTALAPAGATTWRGPWNFGHLQAIRTAHGLVLYHPGSEDVAARVASELDAAVAAVTDVWGSDWSRSVAVIVPASRDELSALVSPAFSTDSIAAVAVARSVDTDAHVANGQRVVLNPEAAGKLTPTSLRVILRHEITHIATRSRTVDGSPMWMLEGFADFVGHRGSAAPFPKAAPDLARRIRNSGVPKDLPSNAEFGTGSRHLDLVYQEAWSMNVYLAHRYGTSTLVRLYRAVAGTGTASAGELAATVRRALGTSYHTVVDGWRDFLRQRFGP